MITSNTTFKNTILEHTFGSKDMHIRIGSDSLQIDHMSINIKRRLLDEDGYILSLSRFGRNTRNHYLDLNPTDRIIVYKYEDGWSNSTICSFSFNCLEDQLFLTVTSSKKIYDVEGELTKVVNHNIPEMLLIDRISLAILTRIRFE